MSPPRSFFGLRRVVWTGWRAHVGLLTLLVSFTLFAGQQKGHPSRWRGLPLRRECHSAAAEELGLEVKQVCWLAGFEVIST